jgi:hypothetical protein
MAEKLKRILLDMLPRKHSIALSAIFIAMSALFCNGCSNLPGQGSSGTIPNFPPMSAVQRHGVIERIQNDANIPADVKQKMLAKLNSQSPHT